MSDDAKHSQEEASTALRLAKEGAYSNPGLTKILVDIKEVSLAGGYRLSLAADKLKPAIVAALQQKGYAVEFTGYPIAHIEWFPRSGQPKSKASLFAQIQHWWKGLPV